MHPLYQRLKELDWDTFQRLCFQLLHSRHPGLQIKHVEGGGGDRGLDVFAGQLESHPTIWQCKHFVNGVGPKQRPQIRDSLKTALTYFKPDNWILVIPVDLNHKAHEWFQKIQSSYAPIVKVGLFQASDIVGELIHRRHIRDTFFPGAVVDSLAVREALQRHGINQLPEEDLDNLIARLERADARFSYQITYGPNVGATIANARLDHPLHVASFADDNKRIDLFARDLQALRLDPPAVNFTVAPTGGEKIKEFLRTGKSQELSPTEILNVRSTFDFLLSDSEENSWRLSLRPSQALMQRRVPLRMTFRHHTEVVEYEFVQFRVIRVGDEEVEIESVSSLPFTVSFCLPRGSDNLTSETGNVAIQCEFLNADVGEVVKANRALKLLQDGGFIELYNLECGRTLAHATVSGFALPRWAFFEQIVSDAAKISAAFQIKLRIPDHLTDEDLGAILLLTAVLDEKPIPIQRMSANLVKGGLPGNGIRSIGENLTISLECENMEPKPVLFGTSINTGPLQVIADGVEVLGASDFDRRYLEATEGTPVPISFSALKVIVRRKNSSKL